MCNNPARHKDEPLHVDPRPYPYGVNRPSTYIKRLLEEDHKSRTALLRGKAWRQTKNGYVQVTFPPPEPYWADRK